MSPMRRCVLVVTALCALVALVGVAQAYTRGIYRTKPPSHRGQHLDVSFTAGRSAAAGFSYEYRKLRGCSNRNNAVGDESGYPPIRAGAINRRTGAFAVSATTGHNDLVQITGRIRGRKASGTFRDHFVTSSGVTCDTGVMRWTALKLG